MFTNVRKLCTPWRVFRRARLRPTAALALGATILLGLTACKDKSDGSTTQVLTALGMVDPEHAAPEWIGVVCDGSEQSTCETGDIDEQIQLIARYAFARPGSHLEVHVLGASASETVVIGRIDVPARSERGVNAEHAQERRYLETVRTQVCRPVEQELRRAHPRRSEIAAAITGVTLAPTNGLPRRIIVMSDLREYSQLLDAECMRDLPTRPEWLAKLRRHGLLPQGSLAGARVHFVRARGGPASARNCSWSVSRDIALRDLWRAAIEAAGAAEVTFSSDVIDLAQYRAEVRPQTRPNDGGTR